MGNSNANQNQETYTKEVSNRFVLEHPNKEATPNETQSAQIGIARHSLFEPVSDGLYDLSYSCLLIPRFQDHYLEGDLVSCLDTWVGQICISYGWKLEYLNIQSEFMQILISVPVSISPAQIVRTIRQQTSKRIFEDFPRFKRKNTGNDFWAPAHLVIVGRQLHFEKMIREFIQVTRQQQAPNPRSIKKP